MWDLKLNNYCNHRIINELLEIKGEYPTYFATLKRPVYGNMEVKVLDEDNLFLSKPNIKYVKCELGQDRKTLSFNNSIQEGDIVVDVRTSIYPKHNYYATYYTNHENCPKCIFGTNKTNDIYIDVLGRPILTAGLDLLIQQVKKVLITAIESNLFDRNYGTELPNLIGKPKTILTLLKAQNTIRDAINYIKTKQMNNYDLLSDEEKLLKIDNFQVLPTDNPKVLKFSFELYNLAGQNVNIGVSI